MSALQSLKRIGSRILENFRQPSNDLVFENSQEENSSAHSSPRLKRASTKRSRDSLFNRKGSTAPLITTSTNHPYMDICVYKKRATLLKIIDDKLFAAALENGNVLIINYYTGEIFAEIIYNQHVVSHMLVIPGSLITLESLPEEKNSHHRPLLVTLSDDLVAVFDVYNRREEKRLVQSVLVEDPEINCLNMVVCESMDNSIECFDRKDVMIATGGSRLSVFKVSTQPNDDKKLTYLKKDADCCHPLGERIHTILDSQQYIISCSPYSIECYSKPKKGSDIGFLESAVPSQTASFDIKTRITSVLLLNENQLLAGMNTGVIYTFRNDRLTKKSHSHKMLCDGSQTQGRIIQLIKYDKENRVIALMSHGFIIIGSTGELLIKSEHAQPALYCSVHIVDRPYLATCQTDDSTILLWEIPQLDNNRKFKPNVEPIYMCLAHDDNIERLIDIPDGFVTSASDGLTIVWKNAERMMMTRFQSILDRYITD